MVSEDELMRAMQKVLRCDNVDFRLEEQREALYTIVSGNQTTPLVVVLPTGGGKSLLFMAPACLIDPGVTIVVVPYRGTDTVQSPTAEAYDGSLISTSPLTRAY